MPVELTPIRVLVVSMFALWLGGVLNDRIAFLRRYSIPVAVSGGLVCAIAFSAIGASSRWDFDWDMSLRNTLLLIFFSGVGTSAKFRNLRSGGRLFTRLAILTVVFLVLQNLVGVLVALGVGRHPAYGLVCGSISFAGGHGTAVTWGDVAAEHGHPQVLVHGIAFATFGLIAGGIVGGPLASHLIKRGKLGAAHVMTGLRGQTAAGEAPETSVEFTTALFLRTLMVFAVCVFIGAELNSVLAQQGMILPGFVTAMLVGVVLTNLADLTGQELHVPSIEMMSDVSLNLFLAMSLVSLELAGFHEAVVPVVVAVGAQIVLSLVYARWVVFRACGSDYEAAVLATGYVGIGLGATPVGMANMQAVTCRYRPAPGAMLVLPLIGAGVLDLVNAAVIQVYVKILAPF